MTIACIAGTEPGLQARIEPFQFSQRQMPQVWFTADTHLGHANIIKYCQRPFLNSEEQRLLAEEPRGKWRVSRESVERHDEALLDAINACVKADDTLWVLGDFCWGGLATVRAHLERIQCKYVNLVWGNHDNRTIGEAFNKTLEQGMVTIRWQRIWLNHYPMRSWDGRFHGSWHLYGHVHGRLVNEDADRMSLLARDVGVDVCEYQPVSFDQLAEYMSPRVKAFEAGKAAYLTGDLSKCIE